MRLYSRSGRFLFTFLFLFLGIFLLAACGSNAPAASSKPAATATATTCAGLAAAFRTTTGRLNAITGSTLILANQQGKTVTVTYSSSTRFSQETTIALTSLKEGTVVSVAGSNANNTYTATRITVAAASGNSGFPRLNGTPGATGTRKNPCARRNPLGNGTNGQTNSSTNFRGLAGTVSQVSGSTLTITDTTGANYSVAVTAQTQIVQTSAATSAALKVGQALAVIGSPGSNGVISARSVTILLKSPAAATPTS